MLQKKELFQLVQIGARPPGRVQLTPKIDVVDNEEIIMLGFLQAGDTPFLYVQMSRLLLHVFQPDFFVGG